MTSSSSVGIVVSLNWIFIEIQVIALLLMEERWWVLKGGKHNGENLRWTQPHRLNFDQRW